MKIGTKSLLFGVHQLLIHPWFVAAAWWKLFGFPLDPRLWVAFIVHDWGYWGKPNMDGPEGETHVELGARIMHWLFDWPRYVTRQWEYKVKNLTWYNFCLYHSRFYAKRDGQHFSKLCLADKYSFIMTPRWLYLPMARATGEIKEYMKLAEKRSAEGEARVLRCSACKADHPVLQSDLESMTATMPEPFITCCFCGNKMPVVLDRKYSSMNVDTATEERWWEDVRNYMTKWVEEHKDMRPDTWTPSM
jgi:hypothetical protein